MFKSNIRKDSIDNYNEVVKRYEEKACSFAEKVNELYEERKKALELVKVIEERINRIANSPKEFDVDLKKIDVEVSTFKDKQEQIKKAEFEAKVAEGSVGMTASLSALGVAVATMGPTAAMGVATTFGVASTGTAISALSGAAATNAALAWIGGGTLAAGGGGVSAGTAFLALAGPVGWTIAGVMLTGSLGGSLYASHKNKVEAEKLVTERVNVENMIRKFEIMINQVIYTIEETMIQMKGVSAVEKQLVGDDYNLFTSDEKMKAGILVNSTLGLVQLINKELDRDDK